MTNDQMKPNRFGKWHIAKKQAKEINDHLLSGGVVMIANYLKATQLEKKHAGMVKGTKSGLYMQRGKNWVCIDGCSIKLYTYK